MRETSYYSVFLIVFFFLLFSSSFGADHESFRGDVDREEGRPNMALFDVCHPPQRVSLRALTNYPLFLPLLLSLLFLISSCILSFSSLLFSLLLSFVQTRENRRTARLLPNGADGRGGTGGEGHIEGKRHRFVQVLLLCNGRHTHQSNDLLCRSKSLLGLYPEKERGRG